MTYQYRVFFVRADQRGTLTDHMTTDYPIDLADRASLNRAEQTLAERGALRPKIVGLAPRQAADQEKQPTRHHPTTEEN